MHAYALVLNVGADLSANCREPTVKLKKPCFARSSGLVCNAERCSVGTIILTIVRCTARKHAVSGL
ncbi:hypothetical protein KPSA1_05111 [Pseudomonas syringae pv. actinidiae]|uniref:Uncharacterized protein n=1 Tax=Pseudomonas syringae pv. actinidiae TaxID=103796 RepID=A0A2V0QM11_PSESF|nr:hypothetical protein KPSA1_05111 [Pseudomonas syringae pv. actinidiae]